MNTNFLINKLSNKRNGQFFKISWCTDVPVTAQAKKDGTVVLKYTHTTMRKGVSYKNLKTTKQKIADGKNITGQLAWGEWHPNFPGLIIQHKGQDYVRLYTTPNKPKSTYFLNGKPIEVDKLKTMGVVKASYFDKSEPVDCITIKVANVQDIW